MSEIQSQFKKDGYVIVKNVIDKSYTKNVYECLVRLAKKYEPSFPESFDSDLLWDDPDFSAHLVKLRAENPAYFGAIYDTLKLSLSVSRLFCSEKLLAEIEKVFGETETGLAITGHMFRMDPPHDKRNILDWHQDSSYYLQNKKGENGIFVWVALHDIDERNGALWICPGSHTLGKFEVPSTGKDNPLESEDFPVPPDLVSQFTPVQVSVKGGDVLVCNMDLFHKSGENNSSNIRFSAIARYPKILADDFLPGEHVYVPNERVGRLSDQKKA